ncbi:dihydroneopterin aldolase [Pseudoponticoccus marisrubri]|uniref:Dihydroneopterin aldolase/epimerase domain-containing protein n=1 Tax=Pseudoponticoccus marisrubri TaxID=1685382 RepID=A0A0W7WH20_9RHOB|nr:dihydroneopterin aldolase [Pseudoponticoccus marisrubri]KUF09898.1 hypothetical protein AVJ23_15785 [Pseudoponticoccus marisrubri]
MTRHSTVDLSDLALQTEIGTYGPGDVVPDTHLLDLTLTLDPGFVLVPGDGMEHVFDYDPLIAEIDRLARDGPYETQEWLMTRIAAACARHPEITAIDLRLRKRPVLNGSGTLGMRLVLEGAPLAALARGGAG